MLILPLLLPTAQALYLANVYHENQVILKNSGRPNNLVYHKYTATLFFSYTVNKTYLDFEIIAYDMNKNITHVLDVPGGYAIAYDVGNDDVYFGGHDGIYKYNVLLQAAEFFAEDKKSIWGMNIGANFYYIEYPTQKLHVYYKDKFVPVAEAENFEIDNIYVTKRNDIYYSNSTATYKIDGRTRKIIILNDNAKIRQIAQDSYGEMYFCGTGGIYVEYKPNYDLQKLVDIDDVFGITFDDDDNIIYSDNTGIYRLVPKY